MSLSASQHTSQSAIAKLLNFLCDDRAKLKAQKSQNAKQCHFYTSNFKIFNTKIVLIGTSGERIENQEIQQPRLVAQSLVTLGGMEGELTHHRFFRKCWWNTAIYVILKDKWAFSVSRNILNDVN